MKFALRFRRIGVPPDVLPLVDGLNSLRRHIILEPVVQRSADVIPAQHYQVALSTAQEVYHTLENRLALDRIELFLLVHHQLVKNGVTPVLGVPERSLLEERVKSVRGVRYTPPAANTTYVVRSISQMDEVCGRVVGFEGDRCPENDPELLGPRSQHRLWLFLTLVG